ncbi:TetR/AcrR family transcriptional regulator [Miltoncostaea marina]|uniref:TetR/AcrR family transcriptional regulator n=1 Tax=Miltoncostaea marina TaxID=2843215 RepID=UPI001C3C7823|nr:TetR/AcrR family transcriptional regulator [Miltoncostaea marina]
MTGPRGGAARERILDAASTAFYREGIRAVGVDAVVASAGVAKATLYRHFPSKDALVDAFLERRDVRWREWLEGAVERLAPAPADRPLAVFDALGEWFASDDFRGCAFINAAAEIADPAHPAREAVRAHKRLLGGYLERLVREAGADDAAAAAAAPALLLLAEGSIVTALIEGDAAPALRARDAAARLLSGVVPSPREGP